MKKIKIAEATPGQLYWLLLWSFGYRSARRQGKWMLVPGDTLSHKPTGMVCHISSGHTRKYEAKHPYYDLMIINLLRDFVTELRVESDGWRASIGSASVLSPYMTDAVVKIYLINLHGPEHEAPEDL
jgi:hypothetical protein